MSFRRSINDSVGTSRWRIAHRNELLRWLPSSVVNSDRSLTYVLLHGSDEFGTGWTPEWLEPEQAAEFLAFLESKLPDERGYQIVVTLRRRLGK